MRKNTKSYDLIVCLMDNGLLYTVKRALFHLHLMKDNDPLKDRKKDYKYYASLPEESYAEELKKWFFKKTGRFLHLKHPRNFNERIQWMKLYEHDERKSRLADKYLVRDFIREKIGEKYLIPLYGTWESFEQIPFDSLPDRFVLKANHGCNMNLVVKDVHSLDMDKAKKRFDTWMGQDQAFCNGFEMHYHDIKRKIIAEKYMGDDLTDYKIHCFDGKVRMLQMIGDRDFKHHKAKEIFLNKDWKPIVFKSHTFDYYDEIPERPAQMDEMLKTAEALSEGFSYVRVDLYLIDGQIYFGEMTFTPSSGIAGWGFEMEDFYRRGE